MKTKTSIGFFVLSFAIAICFSSCTQDNELKPVDKEKILRVLDARTMEQKQVQEIDNGDVGSSTDEYGNIQLIVRPEDADAKIRIYNDDYDSGEIQQIPDGVTFRYLSPGIYTIDIIPNNPAYAPVRIENIEVLHNSLTDLGEIIL